MKVLNVEPTKWYSINGMDLNGSTYLNHKTDASLISLLNDVI